MQELHAVRVAWRGDGERSAAIHVRGRRVARASEARQEMRCEGYCDTMLSAPLTALRPRLGTAIHMRRTRHRVARA